MQKVKGTQDFINNNLYEYIIKMAEKHCLHYNFSSIQTPILEPLDLFVRALGSSTDVVGKEMFCIAPKQTSENKETIALRPEMTAAVVRAFLENNITTKPWNVFSHGPVFRYERPQKGRYRQFHQWNMEMIGAASIVYDAELIACLDALFAKVFALDNYVLMLNFLGCASDRAIYKRAVVAFLSTHTAAICDTCRARAESNTLRIFDCKNETCQALYETAPFLVDHLCQSCNTEWHELQRLLDLLCVSYTINKKLVRGLDYYNGAAFEFASYALGAQNSFCGGGRYDGLVNQLDNNKSVPALGAAFGIERVMLLLEQQHLAFTPHAVHAIIPLSKDQQGLAVLMAKELRYYNVAVQLLADGNLKQMMKQANNLACMTVILIGQDEQKNGTVTIKIMKTGASTTCTQTEAASYLKKVENNEQ